MNIKLKQINLNPDKRPAERWKDKEVGIPASTPLFGVVPPADAIIVDVDAYKMDEGQLQHLTSLLPEEALLQHTPSGGMHYAFYVGEGHSFKNDSDVGMRGLDIRTSNGYIATGKGYSGGDVLEVLSNSDSLCKLPDALRAILRPVVERNVVDRSLNLSTSEMRAYLDCMRAGWNDSNKEWFRVCCAIYHETNGSEEGYALLDEYSKGGKGYDPSQNRKRYDSLAREAGEDAITFKTVIAMSSHTPEGNKWYDGYAVLDEGKGGVYEIDSMKFLHRNQIDAKHADELNLFREIDGKLKKVTPYVFLSTGGEAPLVDGVEYNPLEDKIFVDEFNRVMLNSFTPNSIKTHEGAYTVKQRDAIKIMLEHFKLFTSDTEEQEILFSFLANLVQNTGVKPTWAIFLQSYTGVGKGWIHDLAKHLIGMDNIFKVSNSVLKGKFNAYATSKLLCVGEEIKLDLETYENLKSSITDKYISTESKGVDAKSSRTFSSWMFFSNHIDAVPLDDSDRRFAVIFSDIQSNDDLEEALGNSHEQDRYFSRLFGILEDRHIVEGLIKFFSEWDIKVSITGRAPRTSSFNEAMEATKPEGTRVLENALEEHACDRISENVIDVTFLRDRVMNLPETRALNKALVGMGYKTGGRVRPDGTRTLHSFYFKEIPLSKAKELMKEKIPKHESDIVW